MNEFIKIAEALNARLSIAEDALIEARKQCATIQVEYDAFRLSAAQAAEAALTLINDAEIDAEQTVAAVGEIAKRMLKPKTERELDAANKLISDAIAARDKLLANA